MARKKSRSLYQKIFDPFITFANYFTIIILAVLIILAVDYWRIHYPYNLDIKAQMFYVGVLIAVLTSVMQWIEGRIIAIRREWQNDERKGK